MASGLILLVEDDEGVRESIAEVLELGGFKIVKASDGYEAIDRLQEGLRPCWILMDLTMPRMGGSECLERIRQQRDWDGIPVTLLSAAGRIEDEAAAAKAEFLKKPIDIDTLIQAAQRNCGG